MNLRLIVVVMIVVDLALVVAGLVLDGFGALVNHDAISADAPADAMFLAPELRSALWMAVNLAVLVSYIGLFFRWNFARALYLIVWVVSFTLMVTGPEQYLNNIGLGVQMLMGVSGGILIALIYLTPLADEFRREHAQTTTNPPLSS